MNLKRKLNKLEIEQLKKDCETLQRENNTPKGQKQHENNKGVEYARLYAYYRGVGCSRKDAKKYAKWSCDNLVGRDE